MNQFIKLRNYYHSVKELIFLLKIRMIIKKYKCLCSGVYNVRISSKTYVFDEGDLNYLCITDNERQGKRYSLLVKNDCPEFNGKAMMLTINGSIKFFDFKKQKVLTLLSHKQCDEYCNCLLHFEGILQSTFIENHQYGLIDRFIPGIPCRQYDKYIQKKIFFRIIEDQIKLMNRCYNNEIISIADQISSVKQLNMGVIEELLNKCADESSSISIIPIYYMHCDIHFENVLYDYANDSLFYIDFEYARKEIGIYDIINCAYVEFCNNNSILIDLLLEKDRNIMDAFDEIIHITQYEKKLNIDITILIKRFMVSRIIFDVENGYRRFGKNAQLYFHDLKKNYNIFLNYVETCAKN